jgi:hypothetical protein
MNDFVPTAAHTAYWLVNDANGAHRSFDLVAWNNQEHCHDEANLERMACVT